MIPLTFCNQSETVKTKRLCYEKVHLIIDILIYAALVLIVVYEIADQEVNYWKVDLFWVILALIMTLALCLALCKIRQFSAKLSDTGMQTNKCLLLAH